MQRKPLFANAILMYHSLDNSGSPISVRPDSFLNQMQAIANCGIPVVPLREVGGASGSIAITFDDAFTNLIEHAFPVLERLGLPATVFAVSGHCGGFNNWAGQPGGIPRLPLMEWRHLRDLGSIGVSVGAHTVRHPNLNRVASTEQIAELRDSRKLIEDRLGRKVDEFAYPYGCSSASLRALASQEFRVACGTSLALTTPRSDPFDLPRIDAYYLGNLPVSSLFTPVGRTYLSARRALRGIKNCFKR